MVSQPPCFLHLMRIESSGKLLYFCRKLITKVKKQVISVAQLRPTALNIDLKMAKLEYNHDI